VALVRRQRVVGVAFAVIRSAVRERDDAVVLVVNVVDALHRRRAVLRGDRRIPPVEIEHVVAHEAVAVRVAAQPAGWLEVRARDQALRDTADDKDSHCSPPMLGLLSGVKAVEHIFKYEKVANDLDGSPLHPSDV
jgi:hypothetical protein